MQLETTAATRDWILNLEPGTWFWNTDIPASTNIARTVLHRLKNDPAQGVRKVAHGLYWRGAPEGDPYHYVTPRVDISALLYAGPGAGLYGWSALNNLEWTLQCAIKCFVVSTRKHPPRSFCPTVIYKTNSNQRRIDLTWAEVTILEALPMLIYTEELWGDCLERLRDGTSIAKLNWSEQRMIIRPEALLWAAETEKHMDAEAHHNLREVARMLDKRQVAA